LRMENASPTGTCRTGETRRTINQTIRRIYHCPDPHLPLLLNSSNHQSHLSHMSHSSHYSNSGAEHTPNSSIHQLTFRPFGRFSASFPPPLSKIIHRFHDIADFPCPPSAEIQCAILYAFRFNTANSHQYSAKQISSLFFLSSFGY